jgi:hypothetical protein
MKGFGSTFVLLYCLRDQEHIVFEIEGVKHINPVFETFA